MQKSAIQLENVRKTYPGSQHPTLSIAHFELGSGEQMGLQGRSGSGKSTLLNLLAGILTADSGRVEVAGTNLSSLGEPERDRWRGKNIGYVHQSFHLLAGLTVWENLWLAAALSGHEAAERIENFLQRLDLLERRDHRPGQLSIGQQQRVAVARALVHKPQVVLADEPTGNLDTEMAQTALELLQTMCAESGAALLLVSHDPRILEKFPHRQELTQLQCG